MRANLFEKVIQEASKYGVTSIQDNSVVDLQDNTDYGWQNFLTGFGSFRMPSMLPIAYLYAPIPLCGALVALFSLEQIINGLRHGFEAPPPRVA